MKENRLPKKEMPIHWVNREEDPRFSVNWVDRRLNNVLLAEFFLAWGMTRGDKLWALEYANWDSNTPFWITQQYNTVDQSSDEKVDKAFAKACQFGSVDIIIRDIEETITGQIQDDRLEIDMIGRDSEENTVYVNKALRQYIIGLKKEVMYEPIAQEIRIFEASIPANHKVGYYDERELPEDDMALPELEEETIEEAPGYQVILSFHADGSYISTSDTNGDLTQLERIGRILEALNSEYQDMEDNVKL